MDPIKSKELKTKQNEDSSRISRLKVSSTIHEILPDKPDQFVRWGNVFFILVLVIIIFFTWLIKYPEKVVTPAKIVSFNSPKPVQSYSSGKLVSLFKQEGERINKGHFIGFIEATANHIEVLQLDSQLYRVEHKIINDEKLKKSDLNLNVGHLGELQVPYQSFYETLLNYLDYQPSGLFSIKLKLLKEDLQHLKRVQKNLLLEKELKSEELKIAEQTFEMNRVLKDSAVISFKDFRTEKIKFITQQLSIPQINSSLINNKQLQSQKQREILELQNSSKKQSIYLKQSLWVFQSQIDDWKKRYILISPISGKVIFDSIIQENQYISQNETICWINPDNSEYFCELFIPQSNFGRVHSGQTVHLKLDSYPYTEFGMLKGEISFISQIATQNGYLAKVSLKANLETNYGFRIQYREGLLANAEIITEDLRLLERFMAKFNTLFN